MNVLRTTVRNIYLSGLRTDNKGTKYHHSLMLVLGMHSSDTGI